MTKDYAHYMDDVCKYEHITGNQNKSCNYLDCKYFQPNDQLLEDELTIDFMINGQEMTSSDVEKILEKIVNG